MNSREQTVAHCKEIARFIRKDVLYLTKEHKAGFIGSSFSCADILATLYGEILNIDPSEPTGSGSDVFILSKGHAASAWYAALAESGLIEQDRLTNEFNVTGFNMGVHPKRGSLPGIQTSSGSLGQGVGLACGIALADKIQGRTRRVYVLLGDGECNEGSVWESFMFAARYNLANLTIILDRNRLQSYAHDDKVLNMGDMTAKLRSFGLHAIETDGHDCGRLYDALNEAIQCTLPCVIVANTIKGKGVSLFEDKVLWHYKWPEQEHIETARRELGI